MDQLALHDWNKTELEKHAKSECYLTVNKENSMLEACLDVVKGNSAPGEKKETRALSHLGDGCGRDVDVDEVSGGNVVSDKENEVGDGGGLACSGGETSSKSEAGGVCHLDGNVYNENSESDSVGEDQYSGGDSERASVAEDKDSGEDSERASVGEDQYSVEDSESASVEEDKDSGEDSERASVEEDKDSGEDSKRASVGEDKDSVEDSESASVEEDKDSGEDSERASVGEDQYSEGDCCLVESSEEYCSLVKEEGDLNKADASEVASLCSSFEPRSKEKPDVGCLSEGILAMAVRDDTTNSDDSVEEERSFQDRTGFVRPDIGSQDIVSSYEDPPALQNQLLFQTGTSDQNECREGVENRSPTPVNTSIEDSSPPPAPVPSLPQHSAAERDFHSPVERGEEEEETDHVKPEATFKVGFQSRKVVQQIGEIESLLRNIGHKLPDGGADLRRKKALLLERLKQIKKPLDLETMQRLVSAPANKKGLTFQSKMMTTNVVEQLHKSLKDCPSGEEMVEDPEGLKVTLMAHQKKALVWMLWKEKQIPSGGILADDMGLGKTLSMLSLVAANLNPHSDPGHTKWLSGPPAKSGLLKCAGTLVVCPASLLLQWEEEIKTKFRAGTMRALVYHGPRRIADPRDLLHYDVVITTYTIVSVEAPAAMQGEALGPSVGNMLDVKKKKKKASSFSTLFGVHWRRVILDEAHVIRNPKSGMSMGACLLTADSHWAVTGTPIHNKLKDFYSLIKFLQLAPFDDPTVWKETVEKRGIVGMRRLNMMVSSLVLRRTKEEIQSQIHLTQRIIENHVITLQQEEKEVYDVLFKEAQKLMYKWLEQQGEFHSERDKGVEPKENGEGVVSMSTLPPSVSRTLSRILEPYLAKSGGHCVLGLLLRLRQCCCHLHLITSALKSVESDIHSLDLDLAMGGLTLVEGDGDNDEADASRVGHTTVPPIFTKKESSTKIRKVIAELKRIASTQDSPPQKRNGITHTRIDGSVNPRERQQRMSGFNSPHGNSTVMLLSLQAGGVGLNLTGGNHVFMLDMHWNPALEVQAADRCHRVGQNRDVHIHKFVCSGTVEERIFQLQAKKLELAKNVLEGASTKTRKDKNKLSLNELKNLFDII